MSLGSDGLDAVPAPVGAEGACAVSHASPQGADADAIRALKARDNTTNWIHLAQIYVVIAGTIALAIAGTGWLADHDFGWGSIVLLNGAAVLIIGAAQHQFGGAVHEGVHFLLFKDRKLNELASDWLAAFPIYTSTYQFRVHHLAHHQFVNDPERDPDIAQLKESGHWLDFPVPSIEVVWGFLKCLSPIKLVLFTLIRAKYSAVGFDMHAYVDPDAKGSQWPLRAGVLFAVGAPLATFALIEIGYATAAVIGLAASAVLVIGYLLIVPDDAFTQTRLAPIISHRTTTVSRIAYFAVLYGTITTITVTGLAPAWRYYMLYWVLPLFSALPIYMMLRQWVQHGNADRGRYTNTRVFLSSPLVRYAIFPWGMDYHLPHHMMASVPHYRLKTLHELMLRDPEYREKSVVLHSFFLPTEAGPSALTALGPDHSPGTQERAFVDRAALEYADVRDAAAIAREAARSEQAG